MLPAQQPKARPAPLPLLRPLVPRSLSRSRSAPWRASASMPRNAPPPPRSTLVPRFVRSGSSACVRPPSPLGASHPRWNAVGNNTPKTQRKPPQRLPDARYGHPCPSLARTQSLPPSWLPLLRYAGRHRVGFLAPPMGAGAPLCRLRRRRVRRGACRVRLNRPRGGRLRPPSRGGQAAFRLPPFPRRGCTGTHRQSRGYSLSWLWKHSHAS